MYRPATNGLHDEVARPLERETTFDHARIAFGQFHRVLAVEKVRGVE
jgi:hypothetical protein